VVCARGVAHRQRLGRTAQAVWPARRDHVQNQARVGPGHTRRDRADPVPAVSLGGGGRGIGVRHRLFGWGGWTGTVVFCRSVPQYTGLGRAPVHPRPAVAWAGPPPTAGAAGGGRPRGADGAGGGYGAARRGLDTPDDQGRQSGPPDGGFCHPAGGCCAGRLARA